MMSCATGARNAGGHRNAGGRVLHRHRQAEHAALHLRLLAARRPDPGGPHPRDTEGEGHPHLASAHAHQVGTLPHVFYYSEKYIDLLVYLIYLGQSIV